MTKSQKERLTPLLKKLIKEVNEDSNLRSWDLWKILLTSMKKQSFRADYMEQSYNGSDIYDALENLLRKMRIPIKRID